MNLDNFHKAFLDFQRSCSTLFHNLQAHPPRLQTPPWARISAQPAATTRPMSTEAIEERLDGVPVYALSNAAEEFLLVSGASTGKNLGLFCFNKDDAEALLHQVTAIDPHLRQGSKVVPVALNKVFQLKVDGVAFRLIPEFSQVKNALREREKSGFASSAFSGVPVFQAYGGLKIQAYGGLKISLAAECLKVLDLNDHLFNWEKSFSKSRSLILKSQNKRYRPLFFRKEDLENSLQRASREQNKLNPAIRHGDIQVAALEDVIKEMKGNSASNWDDVIFIPPGFDVSTDPSQQ